MERLHLLALDDGRSIGLTGTACLPPLLGRSTAVPHAFAVIGEPMVIVALCRATCAIIAAQRRDRDGDAVAQLKR